METAVIYFRQKENETIDDFINSIENSKSLIKESYEIVAVIADSYNDRSQLYSFINSPPTPNNIKIVILDSITDDFDQRLIGEIARIENFSIYYFER
ncbi:hypothetical protein [Neobacillus niacini]|uniref:hypothetical protein n=1 Tax=Neobacillus niacini TaxID=86668 RepID=UPI002FFDFEB0